MHEEILRDTAVAFAAAAAVAAAATDG